MRKIGVGIAFLLVLVLFAAPALAKGPYIGGQAGVVFLSDSDISDSTGAFATAEFDSGLGFALVGGYSFDMFRLEGELFYKSNDFDAISDSTGSLSVDGDVTSLGLMVNAFYDFKTGTPFIPYIGAGIGMAQVSVNDLSILGVTVLDDDDAVFAYQLIAGVGYAVSNAVTLDLQYKYLATADPEFTDVVGDKIETEYSSHNVMVGLRFNF
jgi:opacity protein-like surface antigen